MKSIKVLTVTVSFIGVTAQAGRLISGQWQTAVCRQNPPPLTINRVDGCQSVKDINACEA
ncbi:MAG: hypothetical protein IPN42_09425 [Methylococcaceae bacterium]|nr:hypothetical protein [Methylococcaceae bacterium]